VRLTLLGAGASKAPFQVPKLPPGAGAQPAIEKAAKALIKNGKYDQGILNRIEMAIRAYDPCMSCATHKLDGSIAVKIEIRDAQGKVIDTLANW